MTPYQGSPQLMSSSRQQVVVPAQTQAMIRRLLALMKPPPRRTVSQWADESRYLSAEASAEPGRWRTARAEYQRGMMDAVADPLVIEVVLMTSAQVGKTEIINNIAGFHIEQDPAPLLVLQPTIEMGEAWSKDRLAPMLRDCPTLRGLVPDARSRDGSNTLRHKVFPGGHLTIAGANSAASLASRPIRILLCDEVDRYPPSAGTEGDPVTLGRKRTTTFWNRKTILCSTPTTSGASRIETAYEASDKRRYWVPCPHCDTMQVLRWDQVRWTDDDASTAAYHCTDCGAAWSDAQRWAAVRRGEWRAEKPFAGIAGFHISELYSPWRRIEETVSDFLAAKVGGIELLKAFRNTALGETWQEAGDAPEWERLVERREDFPAGVVPDAAVVLTAGIDNQAAPERLEITVWAWAEGYEQWPVHAEQIYGSPGADGPWDRVAELMGMDWPRDGGGSMRIAKAAADTGGQHTSDVYAQLRRLRDPRILPIKGAAGWNRSTPVSGPTFVDLLIGGRKLKRGLKLWTVAVDVFKAELYRRLWLTPQADGSTPPGWVHLPKWFDAEQTKQLVAEQLVTKRNKQGFSRQEWQKQRANEQLDIAVYARAALCVLGSDRLGARFWALASRRDEAVARPSEEMRSPGVASPFEPVDALAPAPPAAVSPTPPPVVNIEQPQAVRRSIFSRLA